MKLKSPLNPSTIICSILLITIFSCSTNPMLEKWSNSDASYGGVPAFDKMNPNDVKEAMLKGMELSLRDYNTIANNLEDPTFENTIEEMERSGKLLDDVYSYYGIGVEQYVKP